MFLHPAVSVYKSSGTLLCQISEVHEYHDYRTPFYIITGTELTSTKVILTSMHSSRMRTARFVGHCEQND